LYEEKFNDSFWHLIEYDPTSINWKEKIQKFIWYIIKTKQELRYSKDYDYDIGIITALYNPELTSILRLNGNWEKTRIENDPTEYNIGVFRRGDKSVRIVAASSPQMGMNAASVLSMKMICHFHPRYLIMTGISAGVKGKVNFGDILIPDQTWDGGSGKITTNTEGENIFLPDGKFIPLNSDIKEKINAFKNNNDLLNRLIEQWQGNKPDTRLQVHVGPVVSVAGVIQNTEKIKELSEMQRKLIGLEMETYGVFYAAQNCPNPKPIPISIKSVADFGDHSKVDNYQAYASYTSAEFMYEFVLGELF